MMATYVLVHGSFVGGWIWQPTVKLLRAAGHTVHAPSSDGCAERKGALRAGLTVTAAAQELADLLFYEDLKDVVLVGTSTGGLILEKLATLARDRLQRLVFLDALVPMPGESIKNIVQPRPGAAPYQFTEFSRAPTRDALENGLFVELKGAVKTWALDRSTPHPLGLSDARPGELDEFWKQSWKATVIRCTASPNPPESHQRRTAEKLKAKYLELGAGHYPMLTHPEETARLLQG
jgi:pimeloyl-ACP methyl ester carboxylesterase